MSGVDLSDPGLVWDRLSWRSHRGEFLTGEELAEAIRQAPTIPADMVELVGGHLEGAVRRGRGRPPVGEAERWARWFQRAIEVRLRQARYRRLRFRGRPRRVNLPYLRDTLNGWTVRAPKVRAIEKVAARHGITADHLEKQLRGLMASRYGRFVPSLEDALAYLEGSRPE